MLRSYVPAASTVVHSSGREIHHRSTLSPIYKCLSLSLSPPCEWSWLISEIENVSYFAFSAIFISHFVFPFSGNVQTFVRASHTGTFDSMSSINREICVAWSRRGDYSDWELNQWNIVSSSSLRGYFLRFELLLTPLRLLTPVSFLKLCNFFLKFSEFDSS